MKLIDESNHKINWRVYILLMAATFLSGALNVYGVVQFGTTVSHHTGNLSTLAISVFEDFNKLKFIASIILAYFAGATFVGLLSNKNSKRRSANCGIILFCVGLMICLLSLLDSRDLTLYVIAFSLGLLNALFISSEGNPLKVTHMTGHLTDGGFNLALVLRGDSKKTSKLFVFISYLFFFVSGGIGFYFISKKLSNGLLVLGLAFVAAAAYCQLGFPVSKTAIPEEQV